MSVISTLLVKLGVDADDIEKGIDKGSKAIESGAEKFAIAGAAVGVAVVGGIVGAMNVESANDKLSAQLGLSAKESERIGGVAGKLYAGAYGENLAEVNTAVGAVMSSIDGMATASSKRIEGMSAKALDFATTFEVDVQKAVSTVGVVLKSGLAKNATEAFDLVTAASQRVPAHLREDVLDAAEEYSQFFNTLGIGGKEAFALLVEGADKGIYGIDKIGDAIKEFTIRSTDGSKATKGAFEDIGLDADKMANKILKGGKSARGATGDIIDGLLSVKDPAKQAQAAIALFGTPIEDLNVKDIPDFLKALGGGSDAMDGFKGSTEDMGKTLNDNAGTNLESFKRQITTTFVNFVGGKALPIVNDIASALATGFGPAVSSTTDFLKKHEAIVGPVVVTLGTFLGIVGTIIAVTKVWTMVQAALNVVLALNPIGLIVIGLIALAAGLIYAYKKSETFRNIVDGAMKGVRTAFGWVINKGQDLVGWFRGAPGKIGSAFRSLGGTIKSPFATGFNWAIGKGRDLLGWFRGAPGKIKSAFAGLAGMISTPFTTAFGAIKSLWNSTVGGFGVSIPGWVPTIGGNSFSIPTMHTGGIFPGAPGTEGLALLEAGERVIPVGGGDGRTVIELRSSGSKVDDMLVALLRNAIQVRGGDVQVVLGR